MRRAGKGAPIIGAQILEQVQDTLNAGVLNLFQTNVTSSEGILTVTNRGGRPGRLWLDSLGRRDSILRRNLHVHGFRRSGRGSVHCCGVVLESHFQLDQPKRGRPQ